MIKCISIDGPDGSGKSTLIDLLSEEYDVITLPRFYTMGMVPIDPNERKVWFRTTDVIDSTLIYISGYRVRLTAASEFKKGFHYKIIEQGEKEKIIVIDRGAISVNAFAYAAIKNSYDMDDDEVMRFVLSKSDIEIFAKNIIDVSILLFDPQNLEEIISRRTYDVIDERLVRFQHEYYCKRDYKDEKIKIISPSKTPREILAVVKNIIKGMM